MNIYIYIYVYILEDSARFARASSSALRAGFLQTPNLAECFVLPHVAS